jgi:hypothetical protein
MKLKEFSLSIFLIILISFTGIPLCNAFSQTKGKTQKDKKVTAGDSLIVPSKKISEEKSQTNFDSLLVIHFHPTVQCSCCINVGDYAKEGLKKYFTKLYDSRKIIFQEINFETDTLKAQKYKVYNSALFFNKITRGKEHFKEISEVWQLCEDKKAYLEYFKNELSSFLEPKQKEKKGEVK